MVKREKGNEWVRSGRQRESYWVKILKNKCMNKHGKQQATPSEWERLKFLNFVSTGFVKYEEHVQETCNGSIQFVFARQWTYWY